METRVGAIEWVPDDADLDPFGVVQVSAAAGWTVVNLDTLKVVEPGWAWPRREMAVRWALQAADQIRREEAEYRRRQDEPVMRGLARSWAGVHAEAPTKPAHG
jgi:hypothetical protein